MTLKTFKENFMNRFFFNLVIFITLSGFLFESFCSDEEKNGGRSLNRNYRPEQNGNSGPGQEAEAAAASEAHHRYFFPNDYQKPIETDVLRLKVHGLQAELRGEKSGLAKDCIKSAVEADQKGSPLLKAEGLLTSSETNSTSGTHREDWYGYGI